MRFHRRSAAASLALGLTLVEEAGNVLGRWQARVQPGAVIPAGAWKRGDCLQTIIDGLDDEVMIIGPDFRVRQANTAVSRRSGVQVTGELCFWVSHGAKEPCRSPWCECPLGLVMTTGESVRAVHARRDQAGGEERWVEMVVAPVRDARGTATGVIELVKDVSENKKLQNEVLRVNRELLSLNYVGRALSQSPDLAATLRAVADTMLDVLEVPVVWIKLTGNTVPLVRSSRGVPKEVADGLIESQPGPPWQRAVAMLKLGEMTVGTVGVAAADNSIDHHRARLLDAIGGQIASAIERCQLYEEIKLAGDRRGELLRSVLTAQEDERRRIARDLHDDTAQLLTALRLMLEKLAVSPLPRAGEVRARLNQSMELCRQAEEEVDKLIFALRPALLDDLGLVEALQSHAATHLEAAGLALAFQVDGEDRRLPGEEEVAVYRVMQEGISNIIKHAGATSVMVHLQFKKRELVVRIEDDGCGFDAARLTLEGRHGLGLLGMKERMGLIGGRLTITSRPGAGTCLEAVVPLAEERVRV